MCDTGLADQLIQPPLLFAGLAAELLDGIEVRVAQIIFTESG